MDGWPAWEKWTIPELAKRFRQQTFKVGEDDDGVPIRISMKSFVDYMNVQDDDSPLYLFQGELEDETRFSSLLDD